MNAYTEVVQLFCDGGLVGSNPSSIGGAYCWAGVDIEGKRIVANRGFVPATPTRFITNNHTEQIAIVLALEAMPDGWSGEVLTDSKIAMSRVFKIGIYTYKNLPINVIKRTEAVVARLGKVNPIKLAGHPTDIELRNGRTKKGTKVSHHNVYCDEQCN